jgi:hypothetical protein
MPPVTGAGFVSPEIMLRIYVHTHFVRPIEGIRRIGQAFVPDGKFCVPK